MSVTRLGSTSRGKVFSRFGGGPIRILATDSFATTSAPSGKTFTVPSGVSATDYAFISFSDSNGQMASPGAKWSLMKYVNNSGYYGSQFTAYYGTGLTPGETFTCKGSGNITSITVVYLGGVSQPPQSITSTTSGSSTVAVNAATLIPGYWLCSMVGTIGGGANGVAISPPPWTKDISVDSPAFSGSDCGHAGFAHNTNGSSGSWSFGGVSSGCFPVQVQFVLSH